MSDAYPITPPPTQDDLPYDDDEVMETTRHRLQMELLIETLEPHLQQRPGGGYVGGNMFVYFSPTQVRHQDYKGPDFFAVLDVPARERKSWVVWEEGKGPDVVIELLSPSTTETDKTHKKRVYETQLRVAEYYWFDPFDPEDCAGFLLQGNHYTPLQADAEGNFHSRVLGLRLTRWSGRYHDTEAVWLRWADADGNILPTGREQADAAEEQARAAEEQARIAGQQARDAEQRAIAAQGQIAEERRRVEQLAAKLRALGLDPEADG